MFAEYRFIGNTGWRAFAVAVVCGCVYLCVRTCCVDVCVGVDLYFPLIGPARCCSLLLLAAARCCSCSCPCGQDREDGFLPKPEGHPPGVRDVRDAIHARPHLPKGVYDTSCGCGKGGGGREGMDVGGWVDRCVGGCCFFL